MSITGNKGEWSEIYALFKILSDKFLYRGDENLNKISNIIYPIIKVLRTELNQNYEYSIDSELDLIIVSNDDGELLKIPIIEFAQKAKFLLEKIKSSNQTTFDIPEIEDFMNRNYCYSLKANSSNKKDINIVIYDPKINQASTLGFSIKSQLGSPSTLLNAGKTTNFIYKVNGKLSDQEMNLINSIDTRQKVKDRINMIMNKGGVLKFVKTEQKVFGNNLVLSDSLLPNILAEIVLKFYSSAYLKMIDLINEIKKVNPLNYDLSDNHDFYTYKVKRFLTDVALGMLPSRVWEGNYDADGGYLIVKDDGEIICYHIYHKHLFENYLLNNTKLETASTSRHDFGKLYKENGDLFIKLNLQIRFII